MPSVSSNVMPSYALPQSFGMMDSQLLTAPYATRSMVVVTSVEVFRCAAALHGDVMKAPLLARSIAIKRSTQMVAG